jgi:hypothetical protein
MMTMNATLGTRAMTEFDALHTSQADTMESVLELPLLLSRRQINLLATAAQRQGLTSAQYLRQMISKMCETEGITN